MNTFINGVDEEVAAYIGSPERLMAFAGEGHVRKFRWPACWNPKAGRNFSTRAPR